MCDWKGDCMNGTDDSYDPWRSSSNSKRLFCNFENKVEYLDPGKVLTGILWSYKKYDFSKN